mgnify:FL=1
MQDIYDSAKNRWQDILSSLGGLSAEQLTDKHQPCPCCGGEDRYRFDDRDGDGTWYCNQCGGRNGSGGGGKGIDLLMKLQNWEFKDAVQKIEGFLGITKPKPEPPLKGAENYWQYSSDFYVARFPNKKIRPLSWNGTEWKFKAPPAPRPLLNLNQLALKSTASVLLVEGEKTCDAAAKLFPSSIAMTWASGCKAIKQTNWKPLKNRNIVLWPDNDGTGFDAMQALAKILQSVGVASIRIIENPKDVPNGWDLADADWNQKEAAAWAKDHISTIDLLPIQENIEDNSVEPPPKENYFQCLGFDGDTYFYQPKATGQVTKLSRSAHSSTNLVSLAPLPYWETLYPGPRGTNWTMAASTLFQQCASVGVYSPNRIRGRGAYIDQKQTLLHLGEDLICNDLKLSILDGPPFKTSYIYQRAANLVGPSNLAPLTDTEACEILSLAERFQWDIPASGMLLAGWIVLGPICGALDWRPHVWLTGGAGTGKSAILDRFITPLLHDMGIHVSGNTTEAGLRQTLKSDALPVVFDEAESNEKADQTRMQSILALARVASSETKAQMVKGSPSGEVTRFHLRSMFFLSSISTALKQGADRSRFTQLTLRTNSNASKEQRSKHWDELEKDLDNTINDEIAQRLIARTFRLIKTIKKSIKVFSRIAADKFDSQRLGDQYGALLGGAWSLMSSEVVTEKQAIELMNGVSWEAYSEITEIPDERRCLQAILQHPVKVEKDQLLLGELLEIANGRYNAELDVTQAIDTLGRHGLKIQMEHLLVSNTAEALKEILAGTSWTHSWPQVLSRLPNASKAPATRFKGQGSVSKAVKVPMESLDIEEAA